MPNNLINENHLETVLKSLKQYIDEKEGESSSIETNLDELEQKITDLENYLDNFDIKTIDGVEEAPIDGKKYCRHQEKWVDLSDLIGNGDDEDPDDPEEPEEPEEPDNPVIELKLTADKSSIKAGEDTVTLTLKNGNIDVTKDSTFTCNYNRSFTPNKNKFTFDSLESTVTSQAIVEFTGNYNGSTAKIQLTREANVNYGKTMDYEGTIYGNGDTSDNILTEVIEFVRRYVDAYSSGYRTSLSNETEYINITSYNLNDPKLFPSNESLPSNIKFSHELKNGKIYVIFSSEDGANGNYLIDVTGKCTNAESRESDIHFRKRF